MAFYLAIAERGIGSAYDQVIADEAGQDPTTVALAKAVISRESEWNPNARNVSGAEASYGLMQLNITGGAGSGLTVAEALDPATNLHRGIGYLQTQMRRYPDNDLDVISAYNGGHSLRRADGTYGNVDPTYVPDVAAYFNWYLANDPLVQQLAQGSADRPVPIDGLAVTAPAGGGWGGGGVALAVAIGWLLFGQKKRARA